MVSHLSQQKLSTSIDKSFRLKASFSSCLIMEIFQNDLERLEHELAAMVQRTPNFFNNSPIVIDLEKTANTILSSQNDFEQLKKILQAKGLVPFGIRGGDQDQKNAAALAGLSVVQIGKTSSELDKIHTTPQQDETKLVTTPIRSGMQVHAKGDLTVTSQVSPGAELMAGGHIHIYGASRGRILAGAYGNKNARIFCRSLDAELIAIAGYYLTKEEMLPVLTSGNMIQIYLEQEKLHIKAL